MSVFNYQDHKHNLTLNCGHEFFWGFGIAFNTTYAVVPLFLKQLGAPNAIVASVAGLFSILIALPQLLSAMLGRNVVNLKLAVIGVHLLLLPPTFLMGFVYSFIKPVGSGGWIMYFICFILYAFAIGIIIPIWTNFLSHVTQKKRRGSFFGVSFAFNSIGGFTGGFLVKRLYDSGLSFPVNFGVGFFILFLSLAIGTMLFIGYRVKTVEENRESISAKDFFASVKSILKNHGSFKRYLFSRAFFTFQFPAVGLYAVYCQERFNFEISEAGVFGILNVIAFGSASYISGKIGDRFGHKKAMIISMCGHLAAIVTVLLADSMTAVYGVFFFLGVGQGAFMPASMNLLYDFAGDNDSKIYMALIDTTLAPVTLFVLILSGIVIELVSSFWIFISVGIIILMGLILFIFTVDDPKNSDFTIPVQPSM